MRFLLALWFAKLIQLLIRIINPEKGTNLPGEYGMKLDPKMVAHFRGIDPRRVLFITGTNGKSSTTTLLLHLLKKNHIPFVGNPEGANLIHGIATSLVRHADWRGRVQSPWLIFEADERYLPLIYSQLPAANLMVTNLQKDQVQRNGDPDFILRKIKPLLHRDMTLFLNADEPRSKHLEKFSDHVLYFGVADHQESYQKAEGFPTMGCPECQSPLTFERMHIENMGPFHCDHCGFHSKEHPELYIDRVDYDNKLFYVGEQSFPMSYPLPYMLYNYAAALLIATQWIGLSKEQCSEALADFVNIAGRYQILRYKGVDIKYTRIKQENPDTLQNTLKIISSDPKAKVVCIGLYPLVDFVPFYSNTFYAYDCDFKPMVESNVEHYITFSSPVAYDTANRLIYEGVDPSKITIYDHDQVEVILDKIVELDIPNVYMITWLSTFYELKKYAGESQ